ncbi:MAG: putative toxin-antitoxin system toxin component, PIN family [Rhodocyclaceae bacterium]|nr:putative toxin-antitoxin system toxin component, PIN family [Rhodocyclaceae bacterium]
MTDLSLPPLPADCVLDTNTVLALWMFEDPALPRLRLAVEEGRLRPVASPSTLEELRRVLAYAQFGQAPQRQVELFDRYRSRCRLVAASPDPATSLPACRDADDQKFLELAIAAGAPLLLSRDKALLRLARHRLVRDCLSVLRPEHVERALA